MRLIQPRNSMTDAQNEFVCAALIEAVAEVKRM